MEEDEWRLLLKDLGFAPDEDTGTLRSICQYKHYEIASKMVSLLYFDYNFRLEIKTEYYDSRNRLINGDVQLLKLSINTIEEVKSSMLMLKEYK